MLTVIGPQSEHPQPVQTAKDLGAGHGRQVSDSKPPRGVCNGGLPALWRHGERDDDWGRVRMPRSYARPLPPI